MKPRITLWILLAASAMLPLAAAGSDTCLQKANDGAGMASEGAVRALEAPQSAQLPGALEIVCQQHSIARIDVVLPLGTSRNVVLLTGSSDGRILQPRLADAQDWASLTDEEGPDGAARVNVGFRAPENGQEGEVFTGSLKLIDPSSRGEEPLIVIPLKLTIRGEAPLFRDQFDVDPVIGQFSLVM